MLGEKYPLGIWNTNIADKQIKLTIGENLGKIYGNFVDKKGKVGKLYDMVWNKETGQLKGKLSIEIIKGGEKKEGWFYWIFKNSEFEGIWGWKGKSRNSKKWTGKKQEPQRGGKKQNKSKKKYSKKGGFFFGKGSKKSSHKIMTRKKF
tara:strand:+ start:48 stop:491 length:444 start_codon:yes stop_codon:yes gene_type:complete